MPRLANVDPEAEVEAEVALELDPLDPELDPKLVSVVPFLAALGASDIFTLHSHFRFRSSIYDNSLTTLCALHEIRQLVLPVENPGSVALLPTISVTTGVGTLSKLRAGLPWTVEYILLKGVG